jgi:hypothetical protein
MNREPQQKSRITTKISRQNELWITTKILRQN